MKAGRVAPLLVVAAGCCWGCMGLFVRALGAAGLSSMQVAEARNILTALILIVLCAVTDRSSLRFRLRDVWCFIGTGVLSILFFNVCYFTTMQMTSLSVAAILLYTSPIFVLLLSRLIFGERITGRKSLGVVLAVAGCVLVSGVVTSAPAVSPLGLLIGLCSGLGYALYSIFSRFSIERGYSPLTITLWSFIFAGIAGALIGDVPGTVGVVAAKPSLFLAVVGMAVVSSVLPYLLYTEGLRHMENGRAAVIVAIEPVVATLLGVFVFDEALTWDGVAGVVLVLAAIALLNTGSAAAQDESGAA